MPTRNERCGTPSTTRSPPYTASTSTRWPTAYDGPRGTVAVLDYWRDALLDLVEPSAAPRHLAVFDWLAANIPPSADAPPALCMGDARLVNAIVDGAEVAALVDFEVAYVGNPTADIAYSLFLERSHGHTAPLPGLPSEGETWAALEHGHRS